MVLDHLTALQRHEPADRLGRRIVAESVIAPANIG
jgi:hypothetical protein